MKKINQEEYEVLKRLDGRWKWIAVNSKGWLLGFTSMPDKIVGGWSNGEQQMGFFNDKVNGLDRELFRFIQSSGPEPYNIAELIEEYESEETEVNKYTYWIEREKFKEKIERKRWEECSGAGEYRNGKADAYEDVLDIINELDEPEALSQEWIDEKSFPIIHQAREKDVVPVKDLQGILVPKQELPVIPKYVADWIEGNRERYGSIFIIGYDIYNNNIHPDVDDWIVNNEEGFVRAWMEGYEVEEEQKYVIKLDDESYLQRYEIDNKNIVTPFRIVGHLKEVAIKFDNKEKAEKVAELVEGKVEELEE